MKPSISIVIPCLNEEKYIQSCIDSLLSNGYSKDLLEIIVIDGGSNDSTISILNELKGSTPQLKIIHNPKKVTPISLNLGIQHATKDFILISGAHASFEISYLETLVHVFETQSDAIGVGGVMRTRVKRSTALSESIRTVLMHPIGVGNSKFRTGVNQLTKVDTVPFGLYKAELLKKSKGYDERLIRNHDMELSKRLSKMGGSIYLCPDAICNYYARENWKELAKNNFNNGKWNIKTVFITKTFSSLSLRHFMPLGFLLSLMLPLILFIFLPKYFIAYIPLVIGSIYLSILSFFAIGVTRKHNRFAFVLFSFIVLHFSYGIGSLMGLLSIPFIRRT